jgi:hypothetical protein
MSTDNWRTTALRIVDPPVPSQTSPATAGNVSGFDAFARKQRVSSGLKDGPTGVEPGYNDSSHGSGIFRPIAARIGLIEFLPRRRPDGGRTVPRDLPRGIWLERAARWNRPHRRRNRRNPGPNPGGSSRRPRALQTRLDRCWNCRAGRGRAADCARANVLVGNGAQILIGGTSSIFIPALCAISLRLPVRACITLISTWAFSSLLPSQRRHSAFSTLSCPRPVINNF